MDAERSGGRGGGRSQTGRTDGQNANRLNDDQGEEGERKTDEDE